MNIKNLAQRSFRRRIRARVINSKNKSKNFCQPSNERILAVGMARLLVAIFNDIFEDCSVHNI